MKILIHLSHKKKKGKSLFENVVKDHCMVTKWPYADPDMQWGSLVVHNLMDMLCINFTKLNPSKDSKEDVLVLTDAFSKFSQAFVSPNQKPITVTKFLMDKLFYAYRILAWIPCDKDHSFANKNTRTSLCSFWRWTIFNFSITEYYFVSKHKNNIKQNEKPTSTSLCYV